MNNLNFMCAIAIFSMFISQSVKGQPVFNQKTKLIENEIETESYIWSLSNDFNSTIATNQADRSTKLDKPESIEGRISNAQSNANQSKTASLITLIRFFSLLFIFLVILMVNLFVYLLVKRERNQGN